MIDARLCRFPDRGGAWSIRGPNENSEDQLAGSSGSDAMRLSTEVSSLATCGRAERGMCLINGMPGVGWDMEWHNGELAAEFVAGTEPAMAAAVVTV